MIVVLTLEDTPQGVRTNLVSRPNDVQDHPESSLSVILAAQLVTHVNKVSHRKPYMIRMDDAPHIANRR